MTGSKDPDVREDPQVREDPHIPWDPQVGAEPHAAAGPGSTGASPLSLAQVNLVVADLDRSRVFYTHLGFSFRDRTLPSQGLVAWVAISGPVDLVLHSADFARWWDPGSPGVRPGAVVLDLNVSGRAELDALVRVLRAAGADVAKEPEEMPWGQRFAVVTDPDGYRWGLKAPPAT